MNSTARFKYSFNGFRRKKWLIIVVNKWDKVLAKPWVDKETMMARYINYLKEKIEFLPWVPVIFTSALNKKRTDEIIKMALQIDGERKKREWKLEYLMNF